MSQNAKVQSLELFKMPELKTLAADIFPEQLEDIIAEQEQNG